MGKNSTPGVSAPSTNQASASRRRNHIPTEATLARLRQFARAYSAPVAGFPGLVLN
ncbi:MAG: hypothetical protein K2M12_02910 [Muribaculaceae bacterium]|nr:hypothetical protein [Muribaculaceae bacterium]